MVKAHTPINWENEPSYNTPLNEANLNKMDSTIGILDDRIITLDVEKLDKTTANNMVKSISLDENTGIFTITYLNGSTTKIDTKLEKISINFDYDAETQQIILELIDGTKQYIDISSLISPVEFIDSETIGVETTEDGKVKAKILDGSITENMLQPNYLAEIKVETSKSAQSMANAKISENNAKQSELNARASEEQALEYSNNAQPVAQSVTGTNPTATNSTNAPLIYGKFGGYTLQDGEPTPDNPIDIQGLGDNGTIEVKTCGKNLLDYNEIGSGFSTNEHGTSFSYSNGEYTITRVANINSGIYTYSSLLNVLAGKKIRLSFDAKTDTIGMSMRVELGNTGVKTQEITTSYNRYAIEIDLTYSYAPPLVFYGNAVAGNMYIKNIMFEDITNTVPEDSTYEPYTETVATIPIDTLYEGDYLEVYADGSGKIVRESNLFYCKTIKSYDMSRDIALLQFETTNPSNTKRVLAKCNSFIQKLEYNFSYEHFYIEGNEINLFIRKDRFSTGLGNIQSEFTSYIQSNPIYFVYYLATPIETPLTAKQVEQFKKLYTFDNVTNFFYDGEITARYYVNTDSGDTVGMLQEQVKENLEQIKNDLGEQKKIYSESTINVGRQAGTTVGDNSTAEGADTEASGASSHSEGWLTTASNDCSHAEGNQTGASGIASHAEGNGTGASGDYSHSEGNTTTASGESSHAEGDITTASGKSSHSEGYNTKASGNYSHAEGNGTTAYSNSHAEGKDTTANNYSHAECYGTTANGTGSHAEGYNTTASGDRSHSEGLGTTASGDCSHSEGSWTTASGDYSHAEGNETTALRNQHAQGHYNNTSTATANSTNGTSTGTAFVIGNGTSSSKSNAFRVTGEGVIYSTNSSVQTGADYAEYFEWSDENPDSEDRVGYFVTLDEDNPEKIRIANNGDYILGIVSGMPSVIGNGDECWKQRYILDEFGRYIVEEFEYEVVVGVDEETGKEIKETKIGTKWKENPDYDSTKEYLPRAERSEWSAIGMMGVLSVYDDGTCQVNGYCKCTDGGIATACERGADTYRVIARVTDNIVKIVLKS